MKIRVDYGKCTGLGICESIAPEHFEVNDDGELDVLVADFDDAEEALIEQAVASCPTVALSIER